MTMTASSPACTSQSETRTRRDVVMWIPSELGINRLLRMVTPCTRTVSQSPNRTVHEGESRKVTPVSRTFSHSRKTSIIPGRASYAIGPSRIPAVGSRYASPWRVYRRSKSAPMCKRSGRWKWPPRPSMVPVPVTDTFRAPRA